MQSGAFLVSDPLGERLAGQAEAWLAVLVIIIVVGGGVIIVLGASGGGDAGVER